MTTKSANISRTLKTFGQVLTLCVAPILVGMTGCTTGSRYQQSTGEKVDDYKLSSDVKSALNKDTLYKYDDVNVTTFKGVVQLSGFVNNREQLNRAGTVAKRVLGVTDVQNNITVKE